MAETIDTRPQIVNIICYAGDTLVLRVYTTDDFSTATWTGQVRLNHADSTPDASFTFIPDTGGAVVTLSDESTASLNLLGSDITENGQTFKRYSGLYDVQIELSGNVRTLFRGSISIDSDITKVP